jgi:diguanylate cyclase (GGDEF)-like protein
MQEETSVAETYANDLLERYRLLLSDIERLEPEEVHQLAQQIAGKLPQRETVLHHQLLEEIVKLNEKVKHLLWISEHMKILHELGQTFTMTFDEERILWKAFELVSRVMPTDAFFIAFYNENDAEIRIPISIDNGVNYGPHTLPFGQGIISQVITTRKTIHKRTQREFSPEEYVRWGNPEHDTNTCIFVPLLLGNQVIGVISAQAYEEFAYKQEHEELLKIIGFQVASAIETARLYDKLYQVSIMDELTNIKNYRAFHQDLEGMLADGNQPVTLIMLDSDHLKSVNDRYGHHLGDRLIQRIAEAMRVNAVDGESVYRYAGDEFMMLAPNLSLTEAEQKAQIIRDYLLEHPIVYEGMEIPMTVSVGIARYPDHADTADGLKRAADQALYQSKKQGKNRITIYTG